MWEKLLFVWKTQVKKAQQNLQCRQDSFRIIENLFVSMQITASDKQRKMENKVVKLFPYINIFFPNAWTAMKGRQKKVKLFPNMFVEHKPF